MAEPAAVDHYNAVLFRIEQDRAREDFQDVLGKSDRLLLLDGYSLFLSHRYQLALLDLSL
jgi:hypothetical protein